MNSNAAWLLSSGAPRNGADSDYRFYEILQFYGMPIKAVQHEKLGDGIMSAIDFSMHIEKESDPKGDRVKVMLSGKFLPCKEWLARKNHTSLRAADAIWWARKKG